MKRLLLFLLLSTPLHADVLVKTGTFNKKTSGAPDNCTATCSQPVTGVGFIPKALIFYTMGYDTDTLATTQVQTAISWTSGPGEEWGDIIYWQGNVTTTDNNRNYQNTKVIGDIGGVGTAIALADLTSFDADGFTLSWTTNSGGAVKIYYIAIGGSDITAEVRGFTMPTGADAASKNFAHGLSGGGPDIVFLMTNSNVATGFEFNGNFSFGAAMSSSSRWTLAVAAADNVTTAANQDTVSRQTTGKCLQGLPIGSSSTDGVIEFEADYTSDDATNVTLNFTTKPADAYAFSMLSIRGGNWALGATNKKNDGTGTQNIATGLTGTTKLLMLASWADTSSANAHQDAELSIGASDGTSEHSFLAIQEGNILPTATQTSNQFTVDKILKLGNSGVSGALTVTSEADFSSFSGGNATVNWTTNDANAQQILWATLGDTAAAVPIVPILTSQWRQRRQ